MIAQLPLGFWVGLLEPGGYVGKAPSRQRRYHNAKLWRPALRHVFPPSTGIRTDVHGIAHRIYALRNRVAHHEPVIAGVRVPGTRTYRSPREIHDDIITLVRWISEPVGDWLATHSGTPHYSITAFDGQLTDRHSNAVARVRRITAQGMCTTAIPPMRC